jgi:nucleoside-diphosphate-sugar epimerase
MRVLVFGADGFIGRNVCMELEKAHVVIKASRETPTDSRGVQVNLLDQDSVGKALKKVNPEVIINCAGVVDATMDIDLNSQFTKNILEEAVKTQGIKKVIICGSAGEYGFVDQKNIPVNEGVPLNANSGYGLSKLKEENLALSYKDKFGINVVVLRIFNPIGKGMADKFLLTRLLQQVDDYKLGNRASIEISRLDAKRDYVAIGDVATAFRAVAEGNTLESVYNVGSGHSTTNGELLELILKNSKLDARPQIIEISDKVEALVAVQANINRISNEFNWHPVQKIEETVGEIVNDKK